MEVVVYANYIGLCRFYRYVVNISRWSPYEGGQLDRFYCIYICIYIHIHFWLYLERNRLIIHRREHLFLHTWRMKHALCLLQFVRKSCVFDLTVQQGTAFIFANFCVQPTTSLLKTEVSYYLLALVTHNWMRHISVWNCRVSSKYIYIYIYIWPASWSSGQNFCLLIMRPRVRFPVLPWEFSLTMVWVG